MANAPSKQQDTEEMTARGMLQYTEALVPRFSGQDKSYTVSTWTKDIDENGEIFGWTPTQRLLIARRSLIGTAALWLGSEKLHTKWDDLKEAIKKEFLDSIDSKTIHELMSARHKEESESCLDYMFAMKALGKQGKMADYVAVKYIVDGIQDAEVNKMMLYGVKTYSDLKEKLAIYEEMKTKSKQSERRIIKSQPSTPKPTRSPAVRYYACGEKNHISSECPHKS